MRFSKFFYGSSVLRFSSSFPLSSPRPLVLISSLLSPHLVHDQVLVVPLRPLAVLGERLEEVVVRPPQRVERVRRRVGLGVALGELQQAPREQGGGEGRRSGHLDGPCVPSGHEAPRQVPKAERRGPLLPGQGRVPSPRDRELGPQRRGQHGARRGVFRGDVAELRAQPLGVVERVGRVDDGAVVVLVLLVFLDFFFGGGVE